MKNIKVSVILTSYNHSPFLKKSIDSVLSQSFQDYELIIIDDCSSDNSCDIIESYHDERIQFIKHEYNRGGGIKEGVENYAKGEYIAILHSDDFWKDEDKLAKQVTYLDKHQECAAVFTWVQVVNDDGSPYDKKESFYYNIFEQSNRSRFEWLRFFFFNGNCLCHPSILVRKNIYEENGAMEFVYPYRQIPDLIRWIRLCLRHDIYIIPEKLTCFRVHENEAINTSGFSIENAQRNCVELFCYNRHFLEIEDEEAFIKVFPEWSEYSVKGYFNIKYALSRMCLLSTTVMYTKLFGLALLNELLVDIRVRDDLQKYYGFSRYDYHQLAGKYDIFNKFSSGIKQFSTLYYSESNEFTLKNGIREEYKLLDSYAFSYHYSVMLDNISSNMLYFRFDPSEEVLVKCSINEFKVNGKELLFRPIECIESFEGMDIFGTTDPMYIAEMSVNTENATNEYDIVLSGEVKALTNEEIASLLLNYQSNKFEYFKLTGKYDKKDRLPVNLMQFCSLFYSTTKEFASEKSIRKEYMLLETHSFCYEYSIIFNGVNCKKIYLRFDPCEGIFVKCKIKEFKVNGEEVIYKPLESIKTVDGIDIFKTIDPIYIVEIPIKKKILQLKLDIIISGSIQLLSHEEIASCICGNKKSFRI
ncbi:glycosyltransferase family 2 protein [Parablautia muri]|nr:glycosyltransferase [Parablautia muri]